MKATDKQVNGSHYADRAIQPIEYIHANNLDFMSGNIVKYATRWPHKGQALDDLRKVIHYAELLIELEGLDAECEPSVGCNKCGEDIGACINYADAEGSFDCSLPLSTLKYETR